MEKASARPVSKLGLTKSVEVGAEGKLAVPRHGRQVRRLSGGGMIAYFDESGSHQGAPVFGLACFVARERQWEDFRNRWRRLLDQQAVPEIHMADLEARRGHFAGWSEERYELVRTTIGVILTGVRLWGFYNAFLMKDYDAVIQRPKPGRRFYWAAKPYIISLQAILEMMTEQMAPRLQPPGTITCVCDRNEQAAGEAQQRFEFLRRNRADWERLYPTLGFASMRDELALQAADVLVYENCRWMQTWVRHQENGTNASEDEMRPLMKRLIRTGRMKGLFFDRNQIRALWVAAQRNEQQTADQEAPRSLDERED